MSDSDLPDSASPACLMGDADPAYFGYLGRAELIDLLNLLLECERAGARGVAALAARSPDIEVRDALREIAADEARFCVMLSSHIKGLLGTPSEDTGGFYRKLIALDALDTQLDLLDRGQSWVADKLREALPKISQAGLHRDLAEMLAVHESNIDRARRLSIPTGDHG
ncbi:MAG: dioxygenase [Rhodospirillales bacterium]|nr:dioxygenase [Rhodospirillales bacterium]